MKKLLFLSLCSLSLVLSSCSSDDDKLTLNKTSVSLYSLGTEQLTASEPVDWESDDIFVATVSEDGVVKGERIGQTFITAKSENGSAKCAVEVKAEYNTYTEPLFDFGSSKAEIKSKETRTVESETDNSLIFTPSESALDGIMYMFENDKMTSAAAVVKLSSAIDAAYFLVERYLVISAGEDGFEGVMINNVPSKATVRVAISVQSSYCLIIYIPYTSSRSASDREDYIEKQTKKYVGLLNL